jgi:hypothetical protein
VSRRTDDLERRIKRANETVEHLLAPWAGKGTPTVLFEFMRRGEVGSAVDGYANKTALEPSGVGGHGTGEWTSVEAAGNARVADVCRACQGTGKYGTRGKCRACGGSGRRWADPIGDGVVDGLKELGVALRALEVVAAKIDLVMGSAARFVGRQSTLTNCEVPSCAASITGIGSDRKRSGCCPRCYLHLCSWRLVHPTSGDPGADRQVFYVHMAEFFEQQEAKARAKAERESREIERLCRRGELPSARVR